MEVPLYIKVVELMEQIGKIIGVDVNHIVLYIVALAPGVTIKDVDRDELYSCKPVTLLSTPQQQQHGGIGEQQLVPEVTLNDVILEQKLVCRLSTKYAIFYKVLPYALYDLQLKVVYKRTKRFADFIIVDERLRYWRRLYLGHRRRVKLGMSSNVIANPSSTSTTTATTSTDTATATTTAADKVVAQVDKTMKKVRVSSPDDVKSSNGSTERDNDHLDDDDDIVSESGGGALKKSEVHKADNSSTSSSSSGSSSSSDIVAIQWDNSHANSISKYDADDVDAIELVSFPAMTIDQLCKMLKTFIGIRSHPFPISFSSTMISIASYCSY